jgi:hypothetical protein
VVAGLTVVGPGEVGQRPRDGEDDELADVVQRRAKYVSDEAGALSSGNSAA